MDGVLSFVLMRIKELLTYKGIDIDEGQILGNISSSLAGPPFFLDAVDMFQ